MQAKSSWSWFCILSQLTVFPQGIVSLPLQSDGFRPEVDAPDMPGQKSEELHVLNQNRDGGVLKPMNLARMKRWNHMLQRNQMPGSAYCTCKVNYNHPSLPLSQQVRLHMLMVLPSRSLCCWEAREESRRWQWWSESNNEGGRTKPKKTHPGHSRGPFQPMGKWW